VQTELGLHPIRKKLEDVFKGKRFCIDRRRRRDISISWKDILKFTATGPDEPPTIEWAMHNMQAANLDRSEAEDMVHFFHKPTELFTSFCPSASAGGALAPVPKPPQGRCSMGDVEL
ncbi:unnamed protein product, partial [Prorocentrum cordatum]